MDSFKETDSLYSIIGITDVDEDVAAKYEDYLYGDMEYKR